LDKAVRDGKSAEEVAEIQKQFKPMSYGSFWENAHWRKEGGEEKGLRINFDTHPHNCPHCEERVAVRKEKEKVLKRLAALVEGSEEHQDLRTKVTELDARLAELELHEFARVHQRPWINSHVRDNLKEGDVMLILDYFRAFDSDGGRIKDLILVIYRYGEEGSIPFPIPPFLLSRFVPCRVF
jgi:hypothetical protein